VCEGEQERGLVRGIKRERRGESGGWRPPFGVAGHRRHAGRGGPTEHAERERKRVKREREERILKKGVKAVERRWGMLPEKGKKKKRKEKVLNLIK